MDDLISRQAAIELLQEKIKKIYFLKTVSTNLGKWLNELPSIPLPKINLEKNKKESQEYCAECEHAEMCSWYPCDGCVFRQIQPKQKTGQWIPFDCDTWECSECKDVFILLEGTPKDNNYNYCPNCGTIMGNRQ